MLLREGFSFRELQEMTVMEMKFAIASIMWENEMEKKEYERAKKKAERKSRSKRPRRRA